MPDTKKFEVLVIGDTLTDAFIKLKDENASVDEQEGQKRLIMPFGTKIPFDHAEVVEGVGNAANAAVALARLGFGSALVANVGSDSWGRDIIASLERNQVDTRFVRINSGKVSNYHYVLWYKDDRTILINHQHYDYHFPILKPTETPSWVYLTSIASGTEEYHDDIADWLDASPAIKLAFQPGTYQMEYGAERLKRIYQHTEVLFLNREEAVTIGGGR